MFLNVEIAITGMLYRIIVIEKRRLGRDFSWENFSLIRINKETVYKYVDWLTQSDCGIIYPIFKDFEIMSLFKNHPNIFKEVGDCYGICLDFLDHEENDFIANTRDFLIQEFHPNLNFSSKFLDFMFGYEKEKVKRI